MKVQGSYTFEAPVETVWGALFDPEVLARTLPGCEKLEREGDQFRGDLQVKMGPVQGKFQAKVDIADIAQRESYTLLVDGRGPAGFGKATARMRVQPEGAGTRLDYDADVHVGGKIASVGQRLIEASSRAIVKQSLEGLHQQIKALGPRPATSSPEVAIPARAERARAAAPVPAGAPEPSAGARGAFNGAPAPAPEVPPPGGAAAAPEPATAAASPAPSALASAAPGVDAPVAPAPAGAPPATLQASAARAPSQAAFAIGVAKEVAKELLPVRVLLLAAAVLVLAWLIFRALTH